MDMLLFTLPGLFMLDKEGRSRPPGKDAGGPTEGGGPRDIDGGGY